MTEKITTCLWFDDRAEEAALFYTGIFKNSKIIEKMYYPEATEAVSGKKAGSVQTVTFTIEGRTFTALNGGPFFSFTPAISLMVSCADQAEVDTLWDQMLADGGEAMDCGWLTDKFGMTWQIIPAAFLDALKTATGDKRERMFAAMLAMKKLDVAKWLAA